MTRIIIISLLSVFTLLPIVNAGKIEINLKDTVILEDDVITIKDISTVTGDDPDLVDKVNSIEIGNAPGANTQRRIDSRFIRMRLNSANINTSNITFADTNSTLVSVESTKIKGIEIAEKAKQYLLDFLPMDEKETTVELGRIPANQWVPRRRDKIDFSVTLIDTRKDRGKIELVVSASADGRLFFKVPVYFNVRVFEFVVITKKKIRRKQLLSKEDVFIARRDTTRMRGTTFSSIDDLEGMSATTPIQARTILTDHMIQRPPTIQQGSVVKLILKESGFKIVTKGLAQQTGYKGEVIKVRNLKSKKMLLGKIINPESVQVVF